MHPRLPAGLLPSTLDWAAVDVLCLRYALGAPEVDKQHRMLFAWYVALRSAPNVQQVAEGLAVYAAFHFADEEAWAADRGVDISVHHNPAHLAPIANVARTTQTPGHHVRYRTETTVPYVEEHLRR